MSGRLFGESGSAPGAKICGLTTGSQAEGVVETGADAIGVNLWPRSKRHCPLHDALPWLTELAGAVIRVAVFVNPEDDELRAAYASGGFDFLQLHGHESPEHLAALESQGLPVFKALGVKDRTSLQQAARYPGNTLLLDAHAPVTFGGTGETMDWQLGAEAVRSWPEREIILAGGLTPNNVGEAIRQVRPAGVDVASGVESSPGVKDLEQVRAFVEEAHSTRS